MNFLCDFPGANPGVLLQARICRLFRLGQIRAFYLSPTPPEISGGAKCLLMPISFSACR